ncbi:MAG: hypothetical protein P4L83_01825 [Nevskia sp.]|nr:hypothetical protein [Nevskia sp.]
MNKQLMYIEAKSQAIGGRGRIGWVERPKSCRVYHYGGKVLQMSTCGPYNCFDAGSGEPYLVTQPKGNGRDKLYGGFVDIDDDARQEYWLRIRNRPDCVDAAFFRTDSRASR